jgi:predicted MFS family arabinose efflux permease
MLRAGPAEVGLLATAGFLPFLVVGPFAGVIVDRFPRRPLVVLAYLVEALALGSIPVAALAGALTLAHLLVVALVTGGITVITSVAHQALVPAYVPREQLMRANARIEATISAAGIIGPALGGLLVQVLTAPIAIATDAISFLVAGSLLGSTRPLEPPPMQRRVGVLTDIAEGLRLVLRDVRLRAIVMCGGVHNFFSRGIDALFVLYLTQTLGLSPVLVGAVVAVAGPGSIAGAVLASPVGRSIGAGRLLIGAQVITGVSQMLVALAMGSEAAILLMLGAGQFLLGLARPLFNVTQLSLRQSVAGDALQGRVNGSIRFLIWGVTPFGAAVAGLAASGPLGVRGTMFVAALGILAATIPLLQRRLRTISDPALEPPLLA